MVDPEVKRKALEKAAKLGVILVGLAATASVAWWLVEGLIAWSACGVVGLVVYTYAQPVAEMFANWRIKALKAVWEANPIETMQTLFVEKSQELSKAEDNITDFETELNTFSDKVEGFKVKYPTKAPAYIAIEGKMRECLVGMRAEHKKSTQELAFFKDRIEEAEAIFEMAKSANKMLAKSQSAQAAVFAQIKEQVSFDKVRNDLNRAFANLNTAVERRKNATDPVVEATPLSGSLPSSTAGAEVIDLAQAGQRVNLR